MNGASTTTENSKYTRFDRGFALHFIAAIVYQVLQR